MKSRKRLKYLSSLRTDIAALRVVKCRMSHERVVRAAETMLPIVCRFQENTYQRVGLCSPETRAVRLGCSHTMARVKLGVAINELKTNEEDGSGLGAIFDRELNWLNNEIHLLDHKKGDAEKALARILEIVYSSDDRAAPCFGSLRQAEEVIRDLERLHDEFVEQIGRLRDLVVTELDKLIEHAHVNHTSNIHIQR